MPSITNASYAYHTSNEAFSSTYYPVSKQNSEVQSQSSGAVDTTDDNYSTFTDPLSNQTRSQRSSKPMKSSSDIHRIQPHLVISYSMNVRVSPLSSFKTFIELQCKHGMYVCSKIKGKFYNSFRGNIIHRQGNPRKPQLSVDHLSPPTPELGMETVIMRCKIIKNDR